MLLPALQNLRSVGDEYLFTERLYVLFEADSYQQLSLHNSPQRNVLPL